MSLRRLRSSYRDAAVQRRLLQHSQAWKELGEFRLRAFERWQDHDADAWIGYKVRRSELVSEVVKLIRRTAPLREVVRDLGLADADMVAAYRILLRHSLRPFAMPRYHTPTALMLLPAWLEAVGALYLSGLLSKEAERLEKAVISMDSTYPLSVLEPLVLSGELAHAGVSA